MNQEIPCNSYRVVGMRKFLFWDTSCFRFYVLFGYFGKHTSCFQFYVLSLEIWEKTHFFSSFETHHVSTFMCSLWKFRKKHIFFLHFETHHVSTLCALFGDLEKNTFFFFILRHIMFAFWCALWKKHFFYWDWYLLFSRNFWSWDLFGEVTGWNFGEALL